MTATKGNRYGADVALEITEDEANELEAPYVFKLRGQVGALKGNGAFSIDDYLKIGDLVESDVREAIDVVAYDQETADLLRGAGHKALQKILGGWFATEGVGLGESDSSEI